MHVIVTDGPCKGDSGRVIDTIIGEGGPLHVIKCDRGGRASVPVRFTKKIKSR